MYCEMSVTFQCPGRAEEAIPRFQALCDGLTAVLRERHPLIEAVGLAEPVTRDDVHEYPDVSGDIKNPGN
ncbi:MAG: hypothetical protein B6D36_06875 [Planctomycetes bacterium UTPLA1]|jgi:hypothetical protein|nr:MAG: hypothetical protein B6D36_06875 [Planctomycetes bacterium UTPLA1]